MQKQAQIKAERVRLEGRGRTRGPPFGHVSGGANDVKRQKVLAGKRCPRVQQSVAQ